MCLPGFCLRLFLFEPIVTACKLRRVKNTLCSVNINVSPCSAYRCVFCSYTVTELKSARPYIFELLISYRGRWRTVRWELKILSTRDAVSNLADFNLTSNYFNQFVFSVKYWYINVILSYRFTKLTVLCRWANHWKVPGFWERQVLFVVPMHSYWSFWSTTDNDNDKDQWWSWSGWWQWWCW